jgi:hypothetical protein
VELLAIEKECVVVEVEILVSWPAGRPQRACGSPRKDSEPSDSLRHCLDEEWCECCVCRGFGVSKVSGRVEEGGQVAGPRATVRNNLFGIR